MEGLNSKNKNIKGSDPFKEKRYLQKGDNIFVKWSFFF